MVSFEENPYWRPKYAHDVSTLLPTIKKYNRAIRIFAEDPLNGEDLEAYVYHHREQFLNEYTRRPKIFRDDEDDAAYRSTVQNQNLKDVIDYLFGDSLFNNELRVNFDLNLSNTVHSMIGKGLFPDTGIYRTSHTNPIGYKYLYLKPKHISVWLENLFDKINTPADLEMENWYDRAAEFFDKFLYAHPYVNGNGRVARFLLSVLLIHHTIVPVCLFSWRADSNPICLNALQEAHEHKNNRLLKSFIIEAVHGNLEQYIKMFDIPVPDD